MGERGYSALLGRRIRNPRVRIEILNSDATNNKWKSFYNILGHLKEENCTVEPAA